MKYYPKSQVKTNLYTNGGELQTSTDKQSYTGPYYETYDGKKYIGKEPSLGNDVLLEEIFDPINDTKIDEPDREVSEILNIGDSYNNIKGIDYDDAYFVIPYPSNPQPTQSDIEKGLYIRYFCRKNNEMIFFEIDKDLYNKISRGSNKYLNTLYSVISLEWKLSGDNYENVNKKMVAMSEQKNKWYGFSSYFRNKFG